MSTILALDAMGGDFAPEIVLDGAALALKKNKDLFFLIFGDSKKISPLLERYPSLKSSIDLIHTDEAVTNHTPFVSALRGMKRSSMRLAIQSVAEKKASAVISAGNTGAYMALSKILLKTLEGVDRPAIATSLPTLKNPCIALDLGANIDCTSDHLVEFSVMGEVFAKRLLGIKKPRIGLLNVGSEELKGSEIIQAAAQKLKERDDLNFYGFVEGDDLNSGRVDVVVTDGFTGNVALKTIEGTAKMITQIMVKSLSSSFLGKLGYVIAKSSFSKMKDRLDPRLYNGAMFLGLKGIAVKSHGGTDAIGFSNAISVAVKMLQGTQSLDIGQEIESRLKK